MDGIAFLLIVAVLFVLWLLLVGLSTRDFRVKRHVHRHPTHLERRH